MMNFLLSDEKGISKEDFEIREKLYNEFMDLPVTFVSKMRHLQPQVGCFNNCSFCSKFSVCKSEYWTLSSLRNIISALNILLVITQMMICYLLGIEKNIVLELFFHT